MEEKSYIQMLRESLEKKVGVLTEIHEMDASQKEILTNSMSRPEELEENLSRKQDLIDKLDTLDSGFEELYGHVRDTLQKDRESYKDEIQRMKSLIRTITDLSVRIQKEEAENKDLADQKFSNVRKEARAIRKSRKAVDTYYQSMSKVNFIDPQLLDDRK